MKNIFCLLGIHKWGVVKKISASSLIFLLKKNKGILKKSTYELREDYTVEDRKCLRCPKKDFEIGETKKLLEEKLSKTLRKGKS